MHAISPEDNAFRLAFEGCSVPPGDFNHRTHLRLAYVYLAERSVDEAVDAVRAALHNFLAHNRVDPAKYHETLTRAWVLAVRHFMVKAGDTQSAADFIEKSPELLDPAIMMTHYSRELLFSDTARGAFLEPNLDPIPRHDARGANETT
jgi:hypothetical protein